MKSGAISAKIRICHATLFLSLSLTAGARPTGIARVRHAPSISGTLSGSVEQLLPESVLLNGRAVISHDVFVPGTPLVTLGGNATYTGTVDATGAVAPSTYGITISGNASLRHVVRRTNPVTLTEVSAPPLPTGTRRVSLSGNLQSPGDFATLRDLEIAGANGPLILPAGTYGDITISGSNILTLGAANSAAPSVYNIQHLKLNGAPQIQLLGPVVINVAHGFAINGTFGSPSRAAWLKLNVFSGDLLLSGGGQLYGYICAPDSALTISGDGKLAGGSSTDRLSVQGNGVFEVINLPPGIVFSAPANGSVVTAPSSFTLTAAAADPDGYVTRVEFFNGTTKLGESTEKPHHFTWSNVAPGTYVITAKATDNAGETTTASVTVISNEAPTVALTAPSPNTVVPVPGSLLLAATAQDDDGIITKVEFFRDGSKIGERNGVPFQLSVAGLTSGSHLFTAKATDDRGASTVSAPITVFFDRPPTAVLAAPPSSPRGQAISLSAIANDSDGRIDKVEFYRGTTLLGTVATTPGATAAYVFSDTAPLPPGTYVYRVRAHDNLGLSTDSAPITVAVLPTLPYIAGFEPAEGYAKGDLAGQVGWTVPSGAATITDQLAFSGTHSVTLPGATPPGLVAQKFAPLAPPGVIFVDFFARPAVEPIIANSTTFDVESSRVAFKADGPTALLHALDGNGAGGGQWVATKFSAPVDAASQTQTWIRLTVRTDFVRRTWDLYANGRMVAADLNFREATVNYLSVFSMSGHQATPSRLDDLFAGAENPLFADANRNGIEDPWETRYGLSLATDNRYLIPAGNGVTVIKSYINGADPNDYYQGVTPTITYVGDANGQPGPRGFVAVKVTGADGANLANAPVTISINGSSATLSGAPDGAAAGSVNLRTDAQGMAGFYVAFTQYRSATVTVTGGNRSMAITLQPPPNDTDTNGLPDLWEVIHFGRTGNDPAADTDGDRLSNLQEFNNGSDPTDYYNGVLPQLTSLAGGDGALAADGTIGLTVTDSAGRPLANAPVTFNVKQGGHRLSATPNGTIADQIDARTDDIGVAKVYIRSSNQ